MVKVIKRGTPPEEIVHNVTCGKCYSQLSFKQSEARVEGHQRDGYGWVIDCPVCKAEVWKDKTLSDIWNKNSSIFKD